MRSRVARRPRSRNGRSATFFPCPTLTLNVKARFIPTETSSNEKAPALRVFAGPVEIGAAWKRTSKDNTPYHSVRLDDPSFPTPIFANLVEVEGGYALIWSR
jgi:uncharacterized protein (DUF736 family)